MNDQTLNVAKSRSTLMRSDPARRTEQRYFSQVADVQMNACVVDESIMERLRLQDFCNSISEICNCNYSADLFKHMSKNLVTVCCEKS
jgi:hypothetical protein